MRRLRLIGVLATLALGACGIDVMGVDPAPVDAIDPGTNDGSTVDAKSGGEGGGKDGGPSAVDGATDAPIDPMDTGLPPVDANVCAACPAGTPHVVCSSTGCVDGFRVFVTSTKSNANLNPTNGVPAADKRCQDLATTTGLGGTWMAWISSSASEPAGRFTKATVPYRLLDGTLVANDFTDLTDGSLATDIHLDEKGGLVNASVGGEAWTGTDSDGTYSGASCDGFTTELQGGIGSVGVVDQKNGAWSNVYLKNCDSNLRLYCFEQ